MAAVAAKADGVHIEVHDCPEKALSDGPQALLPDQYAALMADLRKLAEVLGRRSIGRTALPFRSNLTIAVPMPTQQQIDDLFAAAAAERSCLA